MPQYKLDFGIDLQDKQQDQNLHLQRKKRLIIKIEENDGRNYQLKELKLSLNLIYKQC